MASTEAAKHEGKHGYTLSYFPIRGRAEPIRIVLEDTKTEYKNVTLGGESWQALKPSLAFGQLPVLDDGDFKLVQSNAILRHLGRRLGHDLYGHSVQDHARVDQYLDGAEDWRLRYLRTIYQEGYTEAAVATYLREYIPTALGHFEKILSSAPKGGYLLGAHFTIADASLFEVIDVNTHVSPTILDPFPHLKAYHAKVAARPNLAAYFASDRRPAQINGNRKGQAPPEPAAAATATTATTATPATTAAPAKTS
jgi:glutathione S-transferase